MATKTRQVPRVQSVIRRFPVFPLFVGNLLNGVFQSFLQSTRPVPLGIATAAAQTPPDQARQKAEAQRIQDRERRDVTAMPTPAVRLSE